MANLTLVEIAINNGVDALVPMIEEVLLAHPELQWGGRTIRGTSYKTVQRTALPQSGFRQANQGTDPVVSSFRNRLVETYIMSPRIEVDVAVADAYEDGADALMAIEAKGVLEGAMNALASQAWYGLNANGVGASTALLPANGFPGIIDTYDSGRLAVDAGGGGADTSSVFAVRTGAADLQWIYGNGGSMSLSDVTRERILDGAANPFTAYCRELLVYPGLQNVNINSVGRIRNIDLGTGLTDDMIAELLSLFPTGGIAGLELYMSRRSLRLLRLSRVATITQGGHDRTAALPFPDSSMGLPIHTTDAIRDNETAI